MKTTNKHNLPDPIVKSLELSRPVRDIDKIRVTTLISAPKPGLLRQQHWSELERDVSDNIWAMLGQAVHKILDEGADNSATLKKEVGMSALVSGMTITGTMDLIEFIDGAWDITDYKVTTAWSSMQEKPDWETQLNCYAFLMRSSGFEVGNLKVVCIIRDWNRREASQDPKYPQAPIVIIPINKWGVATADFYVQERASVHLEASLEFKTGGTAPDCTDEERWYRPGKYAVYKNITDTKATKLFDSEDLAVSFFKGMKTKTESAFVVKRSGKSTKCHGFCEAAKFCNQFEKIQKEEIDMQVYVT